MSKNKQDTSSITSGFVRLYIEGDDITINENVSENHNILSYIKSIKDQVFKDVTVKITLMIIDKNITYQIFMGEI